VGTSWTTTVQQQKKAIADAGSMPTNSKVPAITRQSDVFGDLVAGTDAVLGDS
jgi:hypothetical protein